MIGKILGNRYRILRELGNGGMAWVYLAEDINEGRLVAIKVLYPQFSEDLAYIQRFNREARLASTLSDPHIVRVLDYGATRDVHYLVMEYIEGHNLRSVIDERGSLPWREALQFLDQLAGGLEQAHLHGVVHRDIKPQNLMITEEGVLKVLDFGIARARMLPSLTQSGFVGSPYYISPEQAMGEEVDIRSDIYSAGVVLYEMLTGRVPYDAASPWSIISQHIASELPHVSVRGGQLPPSCETLLHRMISKRPEDRFQAPVALRQAIRCVLDGRPLPETLEIQLPPVPNRVAAAEGIYQRARQAVDEEDWQRAVDLLNQVIKLNPKHTEAAAKLALAGRQARLAALYAAACRAMEGGRWQEAVDELSEVVAVEPRYRDASDLFERARAAQESADVAHTISDLYNKGVAYLEAKNWAEAARTLRRVQQLSPGFKDSQSLLAEAERHGRAMRWLPGLGSNSRRIAPLTALALIFVLVVAGGFYFFNRGNDPSVSAGLTLRSAEDLAAAYRDAQTAFQVGDWAQAIGLLDAILAQDSDYEDAASLREQAQAKQSLEQTFEVGKAAYLAARWDAAIDELNGVRQADASLHASEVQDMLCDAHLQRGQMRLVDDSDAPDTTTLEAALQDFRAGLTVCPDHPALAKQIEQADAFLRAHKAEAQQDYDAAIQELTRLVTAEPEYAAGSARRLLYTTLVERGDVRRQAGDREGALTDYEQALAADATDPLAVTARRTEIMAEVSVATPPPAVAPEPTATPSDYKYAAPTPLGPQNESVFHGRFATIVLEWQPVGALADDEYYDVTVMHYVGAEPRYWGGSLRETRWQVPPEVGLGEAANDRFFWWVTLRQANTAPDPGQLDTALTPQSETRTFYWAE